MLSAYPYLCKFPASFSLWWTSTCRTHALYESHLGLYYQLIHFHNEADKRGTGEDLLLASQGGRDFRMAIFVSLAY